MRALLFWVSIKTPDFLETLTWDDYQKSGSETAETCKGRPRLPDSAKPNETRNGLKKQNIRSDSSTEQIADRLGATFLRHAASSRSTTIT